jgi:hypothetical protein
VILLCRIHLIIHNPDFQNDLCLIIFSEELTNTASGLHSSHIAPTFLKLPFVPAHTDNLTHFSQLKLTFVPAHINNLTHFSQLKSISNILVSDACPSLFFRLISDAIIIHFLTFKHSCQYCKELRSN